MQTSWPSCARRIANALPAGPAPMMQTSTRRAGLVSIVMKAAPMPRLPRTNQDTAVKAEDRRSGNSATTREYNRRPAFRGGSPRDDSRRRTNSAPNTSRTVFLHAADFNARRARSLSATYHALIGRSGLMAGCRDVRLAGRVRGADATPYLDGDSIGPRSIKIGDAALALDPL